MEFDDETSRKSTGSYQRVKYNKLEKELGTLKDEFAKIRKENEELKQLIQGSNLSPPIFS